MHASKNVEAKTLGSTFIGVQNSLGHNFPGLKNVRAKTCVGFKKLFQP